MDGKDYTILKLLACMELWASEEDGIPDFDYKKYKVNPFATYLLAKRNIGLPQNITAMTAILNKSRYFG